MTASGFAPPPTEAIYDCGPVRLAITFDEPLLREALHSLLNQYDAPWPTPAAAIRVTVENGTLPPEDEPAGAYFRSHLLRVDRQGSRLRSLSRTGGRMEFNLAAGEAQIVVANHPDRPAVVEEVEQQFVLLLARAWAQAGWTPLHAGSLIPPGENRCVMLCAPSGNGKTTLTAAMLRRGWRTLGDDKTLLRREGNVTIARALARRFHLHPISSRWFPEMGDLIAWPAYSRWTDKRVVRIEKLWPDCLADQAVPAAVVQLERDPNGPALTVEPMDRINRLNTLLRQVAIPADAEHARPLVGCIAATAAGLRGALVRVGNDAFAHPGTSEQLEAALRRLLA
jgi:hypothetical protein